MPATVYYENDADLGLISDKLVAILGYGSQGHAHALNLKDSGIDVVVGLRAGSKSQAKAEAAGLRVLPTADAVREADIIMVLLPDTEQKKVYEADIAPNLVDGNSLAFAHGFNIHFDQIKPLAGVYVWMIAPKGPGHLVQRLEVRALGLVAGLDERVETVADELDETAAQHDLLPEEIRLGLFLECGVEHAGPRAADALGVGQADATGLFTCAVA